MRGFAPVLEQQLHHRDVTRQRRREKRCLSGEVDPLQRARDLQQEVTKRWRFPGSRVYIRASVEQAADQLEHRSAIDAVLEGRVVNVEVADVHRLPERTAPVPVLPVHTASVFQQVVRDGHVVIGNCHQQRPDAVGFLRVHIRAGFDQLLWRPRGGRDARHREEVSCRPGGLAPPAIGGHAALKNPYSETAARH